MPEETPPTQPVVTENIETLSTATPAETVNVPGVSDPVPDTSKTMRNMLIAVFLTAAVIIIYLLFVKFTGRSLTGASKTLPAPTAATETVVPTQTATTEEETVNKIEIQEPDFTEIQSDVNQL